MTHYLTPHRSSILLTLFGFTLCGTLAMPMIPIWEGLTRILLLLTLWHASKPIRTGLCILLAVHVADWLWQLLQHPGEIFTDAFTKVYGVGLSGIGDVALLLFDLITAVLAFTTLQKNILPSLKWPLRCLMLFLTFSTLATLAAISRQSIADTESIAALLSGLAGWAYWVHSALLVWLLVKTKEDGYTLLKSLLIGGTITSILIALQWLIQDFSYVLDSLDFDNYFMRARANYYYYTPATFAVILTGALAVCFKERMHSFWWASIVILSVGICFLNGSRGLNLACFICLAHAAAWLVWHKQWRVALSLLCLSAILVGAITYEKPNLNKAMPEASTEESDIRLNDEHSKSVITSLSNANNARLVLYKSGISAIRNAPLFGSGIGLLDLPIKENVFNGLTSTYSSHMLYLDIALMAGVPSLIAGLLFFGLIGVRAWYYGICGNANDSYIFLGLISALLVFAVGHVFIGQERHDLPAVGFVLAALCQQLIKAPLQAQEAACENTIKRLRKVVTIMLILAAFGWAALTSATRFFPALEFSLRHGADITEKQTPVYVNDAGLAAIVEFFLMFQHGTKTDLVTVLKDTPEALPKEPAWLIWNPVKDSHYPNLREALGYRHIRPNSHAPSVSFDARWWVEQTKQPAVHFIYIGKKLLARDSHYTEKPLWQNSAPSYKITLAEQPIELFNDLSYGSTYGVNRCTFHDLMISDSQRNNAIAIGAYEMILSTFAMHYAGNMSYSWDVSGSNNKKHWTLLDRQTDIRPDNENGRLGLFEILNSEQFHFIRIRFHTVEDDCESKSVALAEIELHTK